MYIFLSTIFHHGQLIFLSYLNLRWQDGQKCYPILNPRLENYLTCSLSKWYTNTEKDRHLAGSGHIREQIIYTQTCFIYLYSQTLSHTQTNTLTLASHLVHTNTTYHTALHLHLVYISQCFVKYLKLDWLVNLPS